MSYCLNPECSQPQNPPQSQFCLNCGAALKPLKDRYQVLKLLSNSGGFARTYLALDRDRQDAKCAIKHLNLPPEIAGNTRLSKKAIALFKREAKQLLDLESHPQIPSLWDFFQEGDRRYLVQEFIPGQNLAQCLKRKGAFSEEQIRTLLQGILPVLQFIHNHQIIHRDIKPANLMSRKGLETSPEGFILIDFGISKQLAQTTRVQTGTVGIGTQGYAPLEQMLTGKTYPASDLYSLGVTCLSLLTGVEPDGLYDAGQGKWLWKEHVNQGKPISENLGGILDKLTQVAIGDRYQSATEVLEDLKASPYRVPPSAPLPETPEDNFTTEIPPIIVAKLGPADYRTLGEAIKQALPDTKIIVRPGFYAESLYFNKSLEIIGEGNKEDIIIESQLAPCARMAGVTFEPSSDELGMEIGDRVLVRSVTFRYRNWTNIQRSDRFGRFLGQQLHSPYAIVTTGGLLVLEDCLIDAEGLAGLWIQGRSAEATIRRCTITSGPRYGVWTTEQGRCRLEFCEISGQTVGVTIDRAGRANLHHCQISQMSGDGVAVSRQGEGSAFNCDIYQNGDRGIAIDKGSNLTINQCRIYGNGKQGIYIASNGAGPVQECDLRGNQGGPWYIAPRCAVARRGNIEA
ncbi:protein kinase domain-containing protein [Roseofilum casamattae]|uniref:non-specific serine/threonine protein kinase n=1 Tax=Roseofilum casamattae BLCC-M143 TaxID=3022442 RepID=A0ABT7C2B2_9CYAN|nr:right-handed parallel beta-helix repeat-containing protein [Roseofilum casamattae]MDJ1185598.1 right-handed parallel beta-helix repeat-containing protein [Roseofilum casamattae BLCC-M143]